MKKPNIYPKKDGTHRRINHKAFRGLSVALILFLAVLATTAVKAQIPCAGNPIGANVHSGTVTITTQADLNAFYNSTAGTNFGRRYTKIIGDLYMDGSDANDPVVNLCNLRSIAEVTGSVTIINFNNPSNPLSTQPLGELKDVGCKLTVRDNPMWQKIRFEALKKVGCTIAIYNNSHAFMIKMPLLQTMSGENIMIKKNTRLELLQISTLAPSFTFIGPANSVEISENGDSAANPLVMNFRKLVKMNGRLIFNDNDNSGVSNFDSIFTGLDTIKLSLTIKDNDYLTKCCIAASTVVLGGRTISGNTGNCATASAVVSDCGSFAYKRAPKANVNPGSSYLNVFPSPNQGKFDIELSFPETGTAYITVSDLLGREIYNTSENITQTTLIPIQLAAASEGQYIVKAHINGETFFQRIAVIK